jgi:peptidoglycan/xylan/chitin deacetylase (PgdA/CDA1 family)
MSAPVVAPIRPSPYVPYSPITDRPRLTWPGDARVAVWLALNVEFHQYRPPANEYRSFYARMPVPDVMFYGHLDYGNRVGFWRMLEVFDRRRAPVSVSLNLSVLEHFPEIREAILDRRWSIFSHGLYNTQLLFGMSEAEERAWVAENMEFHRLHTGRELGGMFGPALSQTPRSMELWAEAGIRYVVDWFMDDQPFPIRVAKGRLVNVTYGWELNDARVIGGAAYGGTYEADYFLQICKDQLDVLVEEGAEDGRAMCVALHPYLMGQPWRIDYLDELLAHLESRPGVWLTTAEAIADHYLAEHHDAAVVRQELHAATWGGTS